MLVCFVLAAAIAVAPSPAPPESKLEPVTVAPPEIVEAQPSASEPPPVAGNSGTAPREPKEGPSGAETFKNWVEGFAVLLAGGFFLYKAVTGYLITNMSVGVSSERRAAAEPNQDHLKIVLTLARGSSGTVRLHDAQARVRWAEPAEEGKTQWTLKFEGLERLSFNTRDKDRKKVAWDRVSEENPFASLSPGEATHFATVCSVPSGAVCRVEIAVVGKVVWSWFVSEWRASDVSLPRDGSPAGAQAPVVSAKPELSGPAAEEA